MNDTSDIEVVRVSRDQISAARALIHMAGGEDKVDPIIAKIANAESGAEPEVVDGKEIVRVSRDQLSAARALIHMAGGEDKVDPIIAKIANAEPPLRSDEVPASQRV
ncbi:MAG: hypothetical protein BGO26_12410 [Actinobacteria bacterium 69-20]|jgi:DNA-binding transcriptional regulator LsrR (DeoR family)|nr:hypothetical protein [Actinomycetota bacterium]OJV23505.1 MAG: hypothetical protein BGO26_12410 [Actinobacteria bacterium 69-20]